MLFAIDFLIILAVVLLDQFVKFWIVANIDINTVHQVIPGLFSLTNIRNDGAAWSILEGKTTFFYLITLVALAVLIYFLYRTRGHWLYQISLSLIIAGAFGNFIDRLRMKYVVDMFQLDFINFPIFNVADFALTIGVIVLFIAILKEDQLEG
ncbi:signal peptidase II [Pediococcus ethanolidurans]|uniref:Lipoprotein signal peptidase n=1 Tax=Pediococcus ethanolidurans TaxID=319653 RepID=A0A0R2K008_9LACO|nr:signal peptidase II [Pediococcus ethanolidurans]KRN82928.1 signal peptidase II [Pediococcus ethanolidurans]MBU7555020.1 signal peptidase II [Pediococcus ethanolidurans]MBU7563421.1 signal peptidase II [Pediococcus ethanolidurans]MCT4398361.1 signal peptidase II [Pediococcus ethanolidurans]MCV3314943.1 signal peptidase II [Pediococcus ethanolidurans]